MPTVFTLQGFRFFFWSNEGDEPMHIHVEKGGADGKIWLEPEIKIAYMHNFTPKEQKIIMGIVETKFLIITNKWNEYFA
ncbi:DUF4160 domain-containing protein [Ferruginibacter sp. HRS2-29]|uniref:DUF4160 domain-containing protein n=1 Tax=Ferruginibacter sp. HRS2-29 TaxID=2487334 RepID=UPI0020CDE207|nr:DUF4160 domain-containing protein [Ferruginibacter sp. HRS2-29]MCP9750888.1 DUF4160 domain-containing protein [Ferruginibacter sp. HRS2-29]